MHTFTINGDTYLPFNNTLFKLLETVTEIEDLEDSQMYLHNESVGTFTLKTASYESFDAIFTPQSHPDHQQYYVTEKTGNLGEEFTEATKLQRLTPDQVEECPNCGGWAGDKNEEDTPECFNCGYGTDEGLYENREAEPQ